jgi:hypothetical protein
MRVTVPARGVPLLSSKVAVMTMRLMMAARASVLSRHPEDRRECHKKTAAGLVSARIGTPESNPGLAAPCFRPEWKRRSSLIGVLADRNLLPIEIEDEEVNVGLISPAHDGGDGHSVFGGAPVFGRLDGAGRLHHALDRLATLPYQGQCRPRSWACRARFARSNCTPQDDGSPIFQSAAAVRDIDAAPIRRVLESLLFPVLSIRGIRSAPCVSHWLESSFFGDCVAALRIHEGAATGA